MRIQDEQAKFTPSMQQMQDYQSQIDQLGPWFYDFELPGGLRTCPAIPRTRRGVHETRLQMLEDLLAKDPSLLGESALDVACHEGYYSFALRRAGFQRVVGLDLRPIHIKKAGFIAEATGQSGLDFLAMDAEEIDNRLPPGMFDLTLVFGLIYHVENPMRVLRQAAARTTNAIIVETQLCDEGPPSIEWGCQDNKLPVVGSMALVDESSVHATNLETGPTPLGFCPSSGAVLAMLRGAGFERVERIRPHPGAHEQFARDRRGVFLGRRG